MGLFDDGTVRCAPGLRSPKLTAPSTPQPGVERDLEERKIVRIRKPDGGRRRADPFARLAEESEDPVARGLVEAELRSREDLTVLDNSHARLRSRRTPRTSASISSSLAAAPDRAAASQSCETAC